MITKFYDILKLDHINYDHSNYYLDMIEDAYCDKNGNCKFHDLDIKDLIIINKYLDWNRVSLNISYFNFDTNNLLELKNYLDWGRVSFCLINNFGRVYPLKYFIKLSKYLDWDIISIYLAKNKKVKILARLKEYLNWNLVYKYFGNGLNMHLILMDNLNCKINAKNSKYMILKLDKIFSNFKYIDWKVIYKNFSESFQYLEASKSLEKTFRYFSKSKDNYDNYLYKYLFSQIEKIQFYRNNESVDEFYKKVFLNISSVPLVVFTKYWKYINCKNLKKITIQVNEYSSSFLNSTKLYKLICIIGDDNFKKLIDDSFWKKIENNKLPLYFIAKFQDKLNWEKLSKEEYVLNEYLKDKLNWKKITKYKFKSLDEKFCIYFSNEIKPHINKLICVSPIDYHHSMDFCVAFADKIDWERVLKKNKCNKDCIGIKKSDSNYLYKKSISNLKYYIKKNGYI